MALIRPREHDRLIRDLKEVAKGAEEALQQAQPELAHVARVTALGAVSGVAADLPPFWADRVQLQQVLLNLRADSQDRNLNAAKNLWEAGRGLRTGAGRKTAARRLPAPIPAESRGL